jgi:hypothetical protein
MTDSCAKATIKKSPTQNQYTGSYACFRLLGLQ